MADKEYNYTLTDFGGAINVDNFEDEIAKSEIKTAYRTTIVLGQDVTVVFKAELDTTDLGILEGTATDIGGLIAAHDPTPNTITQDVSVTNILTVHPTKPSRMEGIGGSYSFSYDLTDQTTWYYSSAYAEDHMIGTGDGLNTIFDISDSTTNPTETRILVDMSHGKVTDEDFVPVKTVGITNEPSSWIPVVTVGGVTKTERPPFKDTGGDYIIDYENGQIQFNTAPSNGAEVKASYFYVPNQPGCSIIEYKPAAGKLWEVDIGEAQFSEDLVMNDAIMWAVFIEHPQYGDIQYGPATHYQTFGNFLDFSFGSHPVIPPMGGPIRGLSKSTAILRWEYLSSIPISSNLAMKIRIWLLSDLKFDGERATFTLYAREVDDPN